MRKIIFLALVIMAGYYAWQHAPALLKRPPAHRLVVTNESRVNVERLRIKVGGQTFVKELLPSGETVTFSLRVHRDEPLSMTWRWSDSENEDHWEGGTVTQGPIAQDHLLSIMGGATVVHRVERQFALP